MTDSAPQFDAAKYKRAQHDQWNEDAAAWNRWGPTLQSWLGDVTKMMLDQAQTAPGQRVLDVAAGAGEPALSAAERVGPQGFVLATDLAENIIQYAQQAADARNLTHFKTQAMDGENLQLPDASFDAVCCRLGLMYMPNRQRALTEWRRVLKPGGRAVVAVFSTPDKNGCSAVPVGIIRQRANLAPPAPGQPGPFSLGGENVLDGALREAAFRNVEISKLSIPLRMSSAAEYIHFARESFGAFNQMMVHLAREQRDAVWDEVQVAMRAFESPNGFEAPAECLVAVGMK